MLRSLTAAALLLASGTALAADHEYQVTGPVTEVTDTSITVLKGKEKWELARNANTKAEAQPKVGDKVTISYTMTATSIQVKEAKPDKKGPKPEVNKHDSPPIKNVPPAETK
jgi:hypothetical protein